MRYLIICLLTGLMLTACQEKPESTQVRMEKISESVYASGIITTKGQYQVFSTVGGLIQQILVSEGQAVRKGDALFVIQNNMSQLNAENAKLASDFANANLTGDRLQEARTAISTAKSKLANDSLLLVRQRALWAQQIGAKVELEQRELAFINARANYEAALFRYEDLQKQLKFASDQSKKLLSISKSISADYIIRSQTDGRVYSISKEVGEIVNSQSPIAIIGDAEDFVTELQVDEYDISRIKKGQQVLLTLDSYKGQVFEAEVSKIDPFMNDRTRTFTIEAVFTKRPPVLYPNLTTEANIIIRAKEKTMIIPRDYLLGDSMVLLQNKETLHVEIGLKDYERVEILKGLETGTTIIKPAK